MKEKSINNEKMLQMYTDIRLLESENIRTGKLDDKEMVKRIINIINKHARGDFE